MQSVSADYTFTLGGDRNLVANFTLNPVSYTVSTLVLPVTSGTASGGGAFLAGSPVTLKAIAGSGYTFANWTWNGVVQSVSPTILHCRGKLNLVANFTANSVTPIVASNVTYTVTSSAGQDGGINPGGAKRWLQMPISGLPPRPLPVIKSINGCSTAWSHRRAALLSTLSPKTSSPITPWR